METPGPLFLPSRGEEPGPVSEPEDANCGLLDAGGCGRSPRPPLPCLLSHNSDSDRVNPTGTDRKRAEGTRQNISYFYRQHGKNTAVLTITFAADLTTKEAQKKLANFKRRILKKYFGASITVREFTLRGRPHFHLVIDCLGDVSTDYNWTHHKAVTAWSKGGCKGAKPHGSLNRTPHLAALHLILAAKGPLYGLGRMELVPVEKPDAIGFYLGGYLAKSLGNKPDDAKGTRAVNYSHRCPRMFKGSWSWANESAWLWRAKLATWAESHGCKSFREVAALFGPRWAYHHRDAILAIKLSYYPTSEHAKRDGIKVPADSIDIRITRGNKTSDSRNETCGEDLNPGDSRRRMAEPPRTVLPTQGTPGGAENLLPREAQIPSPARVYDLAAIKELRASRTRLHYQRPLRI